MPLSKSPLRYPGGKQKLASFILEILKENELIGGHYVEPYAGGAGAALELLLTRSVQSVYLNDSSYAVYSFWRSVLEFPEEFCRRISSASLTVEDWKKHKDIVKNASINDWFDVGFSTFYLNRVNRSGVLSGGLIGGINQTGNFKMDARFSRNELIRRVEIIASKSDAITISNLDAEIYIKHTLPLLPQNTLIYFDPPYYNKANGLYLDFYRKSDHSRLANEIQTEVKHKWILSYDSAEEIISLYNKLRYFSYDLQYNASTVYKGKEVFVFCDELKLPERSSLSFIDKHLNSVKGGVVMEVII